MGEMCSDFSFVRYPVMIILASKPQIWPCFAVGSSISGDRAALPWLRSLSVAKLVGNEGQVHSMEDTLECVVRGGQMGSEARGGREGLKNQFRWEQVEFCSCDTNVCSPSG